MRIKEGKKGKYRKRRKQFLFKKGKKVPKKGKHAKTHEKQTEKQIFF